MAHFGLKTDWVKFGDLYPLPGDILEFKRGKGVYYHVGIADGDYGIYHFCCEPGNAEFGVRGMKFKSRFRHDKLREVAMGCLMRINNSEDHNKFSDGDLSVTVSEIIQRCEDHIGKGFGTYSILRNNCEHKATEMRYGLASSEQVQKAKRLWVKLFRPKVSTPAWKTDSYSESPHSISSICNKDLETENDSISELSDSSYFADEEDSETEIDSSILRSSSSHPDVHAENVVETENDSMSGSPHSSNRQKVKTD